METTVPGKPATEKLPLLLCSGCEKGSRGRNTRRVQALASQERHEAPRPGPSECPPGNVEHVRQGIRHCALMCGFIGIGTVLASSRLRFLILRELNRISRGIYPTFMIQSLEASLMEDLLEEVLRAVRRRGWSARQASMMAVGTPELIRDMRRGRVPSVERFRALCKVLGLEFYVGRPRSERPLVQERLEQAIEIAERYNDFSIPKLTHAERASVAIQAYAFLSKEIEDEGKATPRTVERLVIAGPTESPESPERRAGPRISGPRIVPLRRQP